MPYAFVLCLVLPSCYRSRAVWLLHVAHKAQGIYYPGPGRRRFAGHCFRLAVRLSSIADASLHLGDLLPERFRFPNQWFPAN